MEYNLKIGNDNSFFGLERSRFEAGENVTFGVKLLSDSNTVVNTNDIDRFTSIKTEDNQRFYSFVMPAHDVNIDVSFSAVMAVSNGPAGPMSPMVGMMAMGMMNMMQAQSENASVGSVKYCSACGAKLEKDGQKFCQSCGYDLQEKK